MHSSKFSSLIRLTLLAIILLLGTEDQPAAVGQDSVDVSTIHLHVARFDPVVEGLPVIASSAQLGINPEQSNSPYYLVQFSGPIQNADLQQVEALGGHVLGYIPDNVRIVRIEPVDLQNIRSLPNVRWIGEYRPEYKVEPALTGAVAQASQSANDSGIELLVSAFDGEAPDAVLAALEGQGATLLDAARGGNGPLLHIRVPAENVGAIAQLPAISWVERYIQPTISNAEARKIMGAETAWQNRDYFGKGQIIAVSDSGLSEQGNLSDDFNGRLLRAFSPSEMNLASPQCRSKTTWTDLNGHGTHVAGSVLGNGVLSGSNPVTHSYADSYAGLAPEAELVFMALNTDGSGGIQCIDLNGDFVAKGYDAGARISTNSWGANDNGQYGQLSSLVDDYIWRHKDYLVLFAAGNAGPGASTVGSPATAKNVLTVGASENDRADKGNNSDDPNSIANFSSRGPTQDGRVKPDVVAPGTWILSSRAAQAPDGSFWGNFNDDYAFAGGTSMATPLTAGGAALVREWLAAEFNIANPSAALLKAVMINGATQLPGAAMPSMVSGRGRVDLKNTFESNYALMSDRLQGLQTGQQISYTVEVIGSTTLGTVFSSAQPGQANTVQASSQTWPPLVDVMPLATNGPVDASALIGTALTGTALPNYQTQRAINKIQTLQSASDGGSSKETLSPISNLVPVGQLLDSALAGTTSSADFETGSTAPSVDVQNFNQHMVGGGDFEDPAWTDSWNEVWLSEGIPVRTDDPADVINGEYSMWLGGTPLNDFLLYPIQFPDQIAADFDSYVELNVNVRDEDLDENGDPYDQFCVALIDASGDFIGSYETDGPACTYAVDNYSYKHTFTSAEKAVLEGETAYLVVFTFGDGQSPHMTAFVDDIHLVTDFPPVTLVSVPSSGPAGTTFLFLGKYNVPYGEVFICIAPCSVESLVTVAYADAAGDFAAYITSQADTPAGVYNFESLNIGGRTAQESITIGGGSQPLLAVAPKSATAGTEFLFEGSGFVPNSTDIQITIADVSLGTVGSNSTGSIAFNLPTASNAIPGTYTAVATDSAGRSAQVDFTVTAVSSADPALSVSPSAGPPQTEFVFTAENFTSDSAVEVFLDGQQVGAQNGDLRTDATGGLNITIGTQQEATPGTYTLSVRQPGKQASAQFTVTPSEGGGGGGDPVPQSGSGLYLTLVWTDPPAQTFAGKALVNDLDLVVTGPNGTLYGNGGSSPDRTNNVETIRLEEPKAGTYVITVNAQSVNQTFGAQPFALVATTKQTFESNVATVGLVPDDTATPTGTATPEATPKPTGSIAGVVYVDLNQDGVRNAGEKGVAKARITVKQIGRDVLKVATTDQQGAYSVTGLPAGNYRITVRLPSGLVFTKEQTSSAQVSLGGVTDADIGTIVRVSLPFVQK